MARPSTLSVAAERIRDGVPQSIAIPEFLDTFYTEENPDLRAAMLSSEPDSTGNERLDALMGAICEYLMKQYRLPGAMPQWASGPMRVLSKPWFTTGSGSDAMKEFLAISSPAEFRHHNIFTEAAPLRRASQRGLSASADRAAYEGSIRRPGG
jgi:hypothetical protein